MIFVHSSATLADVVAPVRTLSFEELYRQIQDLPEGVTGEILELGVLRTMSRPGKPHRRATGAIYHALAGHNQGLGGRGWWIEIEAEIRFPRDRLLVADLSGWRSARIADLPDENPLTSIPDWCCEILSPNTARDDRIAKLPIYASAGVEWIWIVDPSLRTLEVYRTTSERPMLIRALGDAHEGTIEPFEGNLALAPWWLPG